MTDQQGAVQEAIAKALCQPDIRARWVSYAETDHVWTHRRKADLVLAVLDDLGYTVASKRELLELRGWPDVDTSAEKTT